MTKDLCAEKDCPNSGKYYRYCGHKPEEVKEVVRIRPRSNKLSKEMELYKKEVAEFIKPGDQCELNIKDICRGTASCVHHLKGRIGKLLRDKRFWKKSCFHCNGAVEIKDAEAREAGHKLSHFEVDYKREK